MFLVSFTPARLAHDDILLEGWAWASLAQGERFPRSRRHMPQ